MRRETGRDLPEVEGASITIEQRKSIGFGIILRAMFQMYPRRTVLGLTLMASQADAEPDALPLLYGDRRFLDLG